MNENENKLNIGKTVGAGESDSLITEGNKKSGFKDESTFNNDVDNYASISNDEHIYDNDRIDEKSNNNNTNTNVSNKGKHLKIDSYGTNLKNGGFFKWILVGVAMILVIIAIYFGESKYLLKETKIAPVTFNKLYYENVKTKEKFIKLQDAIDSVDEEGTIKVIGDPTETTESINDKNITLDLNGHTITFTGDGSDKSCIVNNENLTIEDSSSEKNGKIISSSNGIKTGKTGSLTIKNGTITSNGGVGVHVEPGGTLTLRDNQEDVSRKTPSITGTTYGVQIDDGGVFNFYDGQITGPKESSINGTISETPDNGYTRRIKNNNDSTETSYLDNVYDVKFLSSNLMDDNDLEAVNEDSLTKNGDTYTLKTNDSTEAKYNIPAGIFEEGKKYVLSFKVKKIVGSLTNILVYSNNVTLNSFTIDGKKPISESEGKNNIADDGKEHEIEFEFTFNDSDKIYIQLNKDGTTDLTVELSDLAIYNVIRESKKIYNSVFTQNELDTTTKVGYTIEGWYNNKGYSTMLTTSSQFNESNATIVTRNDITESAYVYAKCYANTYNIEYDLKGGTKGDKHPENAKYDQIIEISNPTKDGYVFIGWSSSGVNGLGNHAMTGATTNEMISWGGSQLSTNEYYKNLTDENNGTVKLQAIWAAYAEYEGETTKVKHYYDDLSTALRDSQTNNVIKPLVDRTETVEATVDENKTLTLDLNEKTITTSVTLTNNGTLTIKGSGNLLTTSEINLITNNKDLKVELDQNGTIKNNNTTLIASEKTIGDEGVVTYSTIKSSDTATVNISGEGTIDSSSSGAAIYDGNITMTSGTVSSSGGRGINTAGNLTISGGKVSSTYEAGVHASGESVNISGKDTLIEKHGTVKGAAFEYYAKSGTATISDATIRVHSDSKSNGVYNKDTGTIILKGVNVEQKGGKEPELKTSNTAVKNDGGGTIEIKNNSVVNSEYMCAVSNQVTGTVKISDGTITSNGADAVKNAKTGEIQITGGTITSTKGAGANITQGTLILGDEKTPVSIDNPSITGSTYGVQIAASGIFNFYDGIITGPKDSAISGKVTSTPIGYDVSKTNKGSNQIVVLKKVISVKVNIDGTGWKEFSKSGIKVALYQNGEVKYDFSKATIKEATLTWKDVEEGTYQVYAGKSDADKEILTDSGIKTTDQQESNKPNATINYQTITKSEGIGSTLKICQDNESGKELQSGSKVLRGVSVYAEATAKTGYHNPKVIINNVESTGSSIIQKITGEITIKSKATANQYTISLDLHGGKYEGKDTADNIQATYDNAVEISKPTKDEYVFTGWITSGYKGLGNNAEKGMSKDSTSHWGGEPTTDTYFKNLVDNDGETIALTATWELKKLEVGDYINYDASSGSGNKISYTAPSAKTGASEDSTFNSSDEMKWQVLKIDESTKAITILSEPTKTKLALKGKDGYINGPDILDDIAKIYGHGDGASNNGARSIKVEDVNALAEFYPDTYEDSSNNTETKYKAEKTFTSGKLLVEENGKIIEKEASQEKPVVLKDTYYSYNSSEIEDSKIREIIFKSNESWLASRCIDFSTAGTYFDLRAITEKSVTDKIVYKLDSDTNEASVGVRVILELQPNIDMYWSGENEAWIIKEGTTSAQTSNISTTNKITKKEETTLKNSNININKENANITPEEEKHAEDTTLNELPQTEESVEQSIEQTIQETPKIAKIEDNMYETINEAIASAKSGDIIELLDNIVLKEELIVEQDKNITININGKTITSEQSNTINNKGKLKITGNGIIKNEQLNGTVIINSGELNVENLVIATDKNGGKGIYNDNGNITLKSGKVITQGIGGIAVYNTGSNSSANIDRTIIEIRGDGSKGIYNDSKAVIKGGNILVSSDDSIGVYNSKKAKELNINGNTEILIKSKTIENYELIKDTDQFKEELEQMKPSYGIFNDALGNVILERATIKVERLKSIGIKNNATGEISLGKEDEKYDSATPIIYAISDNTTALQNSKNGKINFYDGRFITQTSIKSLISRILEKYEIIEKFNEKSIVTLLNEIVVNNEMNDNE